MKTEYVDVLIVGAGLSGIDAAYHLQKYCPKKTYLILEARERIGGTWDFFRYPGIRSDSDMFTMSYNLRPWGSGKNLADGHSIREYITDTAKSGAIDKNIRFRHKVTHASWSTKDALWTIKAVRESDTGEETIIFKANFLISCAGYYKYDEGYTPDFPGKNLFEGLIIHPQAWPEDLDYANKRIVVIGSGATAITLIPALAKTATHVTMLQRSPTYIASIPSINENHVQRLQSLSVDEAYILTRQERINEFRDLLNSAKSNPEEFKKAIHTATQKALGELYNPVDFTPSYNPWDQRFCAIPDNDLFIAMCEGRASIVTDKIEAFTEKGIRLKSGVELKADIIVTATGFNLNVFGGIELSIDGMMLEKSKPFITYKGVMFLNIPNFAAVRGYTTASWTLKADLACFYICRVLDHMDKINARQVTPRSKEEIVAVKPISNLTSGYLKRAQLNLMQGDNEPWVYYQDYLKDIALLKDKPVEDDALEFSNKPGNT